MTLIIGAKCQDGAILAADRKVMRGYESSFESKIFEIGGIAVSIAGLTGIRDDFLYLTNVRISREALRSSFEVKLEIEDIVKRLSDRYRERFKEMPGAEKIEALFIGLEGLDRGEAQLYHILGEGFAEITPFLCIGHGADYATSLGKFIFSPDLTAEEAADLVTFLIYWVSGDLDTSVGGVPEVLMIKNDDPHFFSLPEEKIEQIEKKVKDIKGSLREFILGRLP